MKVMLRRSIQRVLGSGLVLLVTLQAPAQVTTAFTYQGELERGGAPANGSFDFEFVLFDDASGGVAFAGPVNVEDAPVLGGLFTVAVDFGMDVFGMMDAWLEIRVRDGADSGGFTILAPRQQLTPAPLATHALNVEENAIGSAQIADGAVGASDVDAAALQLRISESCTPGSYVRAIALDGTVTCDSDAGLVTVTGADIVDGSIAAADLGAESVGAAAIVSAEVQARVDGSCAANQAIRVVAETGAVTCVNLADGDITGIETPPGSGLDGGCTAGTCSLSVDSTDLNGTNPVGSASTVTNVNTNTEWTTLETFEVSSGSRPGQVMVIGNARVRCRNCVSPNGRTTCAMGFTAASPGSPSSSGISDTQVGFINGELTFDNVSNVEEFSQAANTTVTYYLRGRSLQASADCSFDQINAAGVFVPN